MRTSRNYGHETHRQRMKARSRALHRLAALHRPDFLRLLAEEQQALEAQAAAAAALAAELDAIELATELLGVLRPVSAPREWHAELVAQARGDL